MKQRLAILGSYPPPHTGITLHVKRLCGLLDARGVPYVVYNATSAAGDGQRVISVQRGRRTWLLRYLLTGREPVVYILSARLSAWIIGALMASLRNKRVLVRLRNDALLQYVERGGLRRRFAGFALRRMHAVIAVNRELSQTARQIGVDADRVHHFPGFLPPADDELAHDGVADDVWRFADAHRPLLVANGKVNFYDGVDLYGFDQLVELTKRLAEIYPNVGMLICLADHRATDDTYVDELRATARAGGVEGNVLFATAGGALLPLLPHCDAFLRPTNTDGDANSLREALACGVPALASDVVERPAGTVVFRMRDLDDMEAKVRSVLALGSPEPCGDRPEVSNEDRERANAYVNLLTEAVGIDPK